MVMIYLDYAATTPIDPVVLHSMQEHEQHTYGNPSSAHAAGRTARTVLETARTTIADFTGYQADEVLFMGSGTESINVALQSIVQAYKTAHSTPGTIITTALEHKAVREVCAHLQVAGWNILELPIEPTGIISLAALKEALQQSPALVTIQWVNSEVGTVQPIEQIATLCKEYGVPYHCDASQGIAHLPLPRTLPDYLSFSAHKLYGPKGISVLCAQKKQFVTPIIHGGGQEFGLRSGTENVPAIAGFAKAVTQLTLHKAEYEQHIQNLATHFVQSLALLPQFSVLQTTPKVPNIINFACTTITADALMMRADMAGFCISTGSACSIGSSEPSATLQALGVPESAIKHHIRVSIGPWTTAAELDSFSVFLTTIG